MRRLSILLFVLLATPGAGHAQGRYESAVRIGQVDSVFSATLDETRPYLVYTPPSYDAESAATQRFPVLYLLDGDAHFHSVSGLIQILGTGVNGTYVIPEMIVVAIPNTDRTRDLTPPSSPSCGTS
jgi:predicted alpha/beta superfamily hydrolase